MGLSRQLSAKLIDLAVINFIKVWQSCPEPDTVEQLAWGMTHSGDSHSLYWDDYSPGFGFVLIAKWSFEFAPTFMITRYHALKIATLQAFLSGGTVLQSPVAMMKNEFLLSPFPFYSPLICLNSWQCAIICCWEWVFVSPLRLVDLTAADWFHNWPHRRRQCCSLTPEWTCDMIQDGDLRPQLYRYQGY